MTVSRRMIILLGLFAITAAATVRTGAVAGPERHLRLLKSEPAEGATLEAAPESIQLWFSEAPEVKVMTIRLKDPAGQSRKLEGITVDERDPRHVVVAVGSMAVSGAYSFEWRTMSDDGHVVNGEVAFRLKAEQ